MHEGLSVVIPNYNGAGLFPFTLPTVFRALERAGLPYEVLVVDDASTDDSLSFLSINFPEAVVLTSESNKGFSVTANRGMAAARFDLVLLLNSDVKLEPDYFRSQFRYFEQPDTFGVMGRIVGWNDEVIQDGAKYPSFHNAKIKTSKNYLLEDRNEMSKGLYTSYLSGANALIDKNKFLELGGFNELFSPFYVEDFELSLRAWRLGYKCWYDHDSVCRHKTSTSIRSKSRKDYIKMVSLRNKWFVHAIHLEPFRLFLWGLQTSGEILLQLLLMKKYYAQALGAFIKNYRGVSRSRTQLKQFAQDRRLLSVHEVADLIHATVKDKKIKFF